MKDARTILTEWFQSGKNRRLTWKESCVLTAMSGTAYLQLYDEIERRVEAEKTARDKRRGIV